MTGSVFLPIVDIGIGVQAHLGVVVFGVSYKPNDRSALWYPEHTRLRLDDWVGMRGLGFY